MGLTAGGPNRPAALPASYVESCQTATKLPCATLALSLHNFPAEAAADVSQQVFIVKPKYHFARLFIDGSPAALSTRLIANLNLAHFNPPPVGGKCDPTQMGHLEGDRSKGLLRGPPA